jgi:hypothetical protein
VVDGPPRVSIADHVARLSILRAAAGKIAEDDVATLSAAAWADTLRAVRLSVPRD